MKSKLILALAFISLGGCASSSNLSQLKSDFESNKTEVAERMAYTEYKLQVETCRTDTLICMILTKDFSQNKLRACVAFNQQCVTEARSSYVSKTGKQVPEDKTAAED